MCPVSTQLSLGESVRSMGMFLNGASNKSFEKGQNPWHFILVLCSLPFPSVLVEDVDTVPGGEAAGLPMRKHIPC